MQLIAHTKYTFGNSVVVVGNTGSNSTNEAVHATKQGFAVGMVRIVVYYFILYMTEYFIILMRYN